jgi:hypothetical protein
MQEDDIRPEREMESINPIVSKEEDEWLRDRYEDSSRWIVHLSNGERVIQDDGRPGVTPESAWLRLQKYCEINKVHIKSMYVQFRSHIEHMPNDRDGYYFCKAILGEWGATRAVQMYNIGSVCNNQVEVIKWRIPELIPFGDEVRTIEECEKFIIWRQQ